MGKKLLTWFDANGRHDLPWRKTNDMYKVYLSETMLQQTQVSRVMEEYYPKFLSRFPTLFLLSQAPLEEVLSLWSGLGYYTRARNLHKTAQITKGVLPKTKQELVELPGIGEYTASAICSFALNLPVAVVDTNIKRVLKRYGALLDASDKLVLEYAQSFLDTNHPKEHNLALMDLGAMLCTPTNPKCDLCPLQDACLGKENPTLYAKKQKKEYISMELFFGINIQNGKIAMTHSTNGMYEKMLLFPQIDPIEENFLGSYKHAYTKYRLDVKLYKTDFVPDDVVWVEIDSFLEGHFPSLVKKGFRFFPK